jgi:hypothetical protein
VAKLSEVCVHHSLPSAFSHAPEKSNHIVVYLENFSKGLNKPEAVRFQCPLVQVEENGQPTGRILILGNDYLFVFDQPKAQDRGQNKGPRVALVCLLLLAVFILLFLLIFRK